MFGRRAKGMKAKVVLKIHRASELPPSLDKKMLYVAWKRSSGKKVASGM